MNQNSTPTSSCGPFSTRRKDKGAIALQSCSTCRLRKRKCDEQRPNCGLCQKRKLECRYTEPRLIKKDKTLVEILEKLTSLEGKVDQLPTSHTSSLRPPYPFYASRPPLGMEHDSYLFATPTSYQTSHRHSAAAHRMLIWPAIQQLLLQSMLPAIVDVKTLEQRGSCFMVMANRYVPNFLLLDDLVPNRNPGDMQSLAPKSASGQRVTFPKLNRAEMHRLATSYFDTFNIMYRLMSRQTFFLNTLTRVQSEGFDGDADSVISLLVFALGDLAIESAADLSSNCYRGCLSGVKDGATKPPGLAYFNEARKRMGFVISQCDLETVQIFSLAAMYYESCSRHMDFWRMSVSASLACKVLVAGNSVEWTSQRGELIRRAFWHCAIMESSLYFELDLPLTGLIELGEQNNLPSINGQGNQPSHFEELSTSQKALWLLYVSVHRALSSSPSNIGLSRNFDALYFEFVKGLVSQLDQWRTLLPANLQWPEDHPENFLYAQPRSTRAFDELIDPNLTSQTSQPLLSADLSVNYIQYLFVHDIQVAFLKTQYTHAKYMIYRPYIYKALHFPDSMVQQDYDGAAECLRCCLKYPFALSPASQHKRMTPNLFSWSQNFLNILIIIHLTQHNEILRDVRTRLCGPSFEFEIDTAVRIMIDWIRDLKSSDPISLWCWEILKGIYRLEP